MRKQIEDGKVAERIEWERSTAAAADAETQRREATSKSVTAAPQAKSSICPAAAKRAINKMGLCGLNTDGITPASLCAAMDYDTLSYAGSRSCAELSKILFDR